MSTYCIYGHVPNVYTIIDVRKVHALRWVRYILRHESACRIDFSYIYEKFILHALVSTSTCVSHDVGRI
jgi:hypothetical protein